MKRIVLMIAILIAALFAAAIAEDTQPVETEAPTAAPVETAVPTEIPSPTEAPTESPAETEAPAETESPTESPLPDETIAPTEKPAPKRTAAPAKPRITFPRKPLNSVQQIRLNAKRLPAKKPRSYTRITRARDWIGVEYSSEPGLPIPAKFQIDYPDTIITIGGVDRSVATSGCGATCLSMALEYLNGESPDPAELFSKSIQDGKYRGYGWSAELICHYAREYGAKARKIPADADAIRAALEAGKPVIALMGPGIFTESGHYIVLRGIAENSKILINDPNSRSNTKKAFPLETLIRESKGETPFIICES